MNKNLILYVIYLYILFSIEEWMVHKYLMHSKSEMHIAKAHIKHHLNTNTDMSLKELDKNYSDNNIFICWRETFLILIFGLSSALLLNRYFNIDRNIVIVLSLIMVIYQSSFWNTIHPDIHNFKEKLSIIDGIPGFYLLKYHPLYDWLKHNHIQHHFIKGAKKGNYNITMPFADFLFNTYNK